MSLAHVWKVTMVTILRQFEPVKIVGMNPDASRPSGKGALLDIVLMLEPRPRGTWSDVFHNLWARHLYMMKRAVVVSGSSMTVTCMEDELEGGLLAELQKVVEAANVAFKEIIDRTDAERARQEAEALAERQRIAGLANRLKFD